MTQKSLTEIIDLIHNKLPFTCTLWDGSLTLTVTEYLPYLSTALHDGTNLRPALYNMCNLSNEERWTEEAVQTDSFIASLPITLIANDSKFEYDLLRSPEECILTCIHDKSIWAGEISKSDRVISQEKHQTFYTILFHLVKKLEDDYKSVIIFDIQAFNWRKNVGKNKLPVFKVLTNDHTQLKKYDEYISSWTKELLKLEINNSKCDVELFARDEHESYLCNFISQHFSNTLVISTQIKKIYCHEQKGVIYSEIVDDIHSHLKLAILNLAAHFIKSESSFRFKNKFILLNSEIEQLVYDIDESLAYLSKIDTLHFINPINLESEKKRFFSGKKIIPKFKYNPITFDPIKLKRDMYQLPIHKISEINLKLLFEKIIENNAEKIDLLSSRETLHAKYNSQKLYGSPNEKDLHNSHYLLHCADILSSREKISDEETGKIIAEHIDFYGFKAKVEYVSNLASKALASGTNLVKIRENEVFDTDEAIALAHHEVGIHMLTSMNAKEQRLKFLQVGLPGSTETQEGLAVFSEFMSGKIKVARLKELALRTIAIDYMVKGADFLECYNTLIAKYNTIPDKLLQ